ncbi:glycoside hydrolase family 17 protein [Emericellopsis atlantica]|uniref:Glycoside hydrolase family 17 protein n=1 Tax=Emericellopsis atlantica TaxID=2614577 RepID=A0A9P7ZUJ7_9HYPO|nr:glycoside hydrolase family 17 protein [Emericellopsis atlantica]KAG9258032.1 glycoside hydrolase family 17 protein [Emericellopsis atlantica]
MRFTSTIAAGIAAVGAVADGSNYLGFNSGATLADRSAKFKADFAAEFKTAAKLNGAPGKFNSARLYTNIQAYSQEDPIEAFDAAVETKTHLLLGVWASGTDNIDKEISALNKAIEKYGSELTDLIIGVNIGSEDLYRTSVTGLKNDPEGVGASPKTIVSFINDWRKAFKSSAIADVPVGHADTWDVWNNSTNKAVIDAVDFISVHEYPYYENDKGNSIENAGKLFDSAYQATLAAAGDKPVWVTETGWPYVGETWDEAVASVENAEKYWKEVGCKKLFNKTPTFWYTLRDSNPANSMKFAITDKLSTEPRFDLSCPKDSGDEKDKESKTSTSSEATKTHTSADHTSMVTSSSATATNGGSDNSEESSGNSSGSGSGSGNGSTSGSDNSSDAEASNTSDGAGAVATPSGDNGAGLLKISAAGALAALSALALF